jgi:hypothetical protein
LASRVFVALRFGRFANHPYRFVGPIGPCGPSRYPGGAASFLSVIRAEAGIHG